MPRSNPSWIVAIVLFFTFSSLYFATYTTNLPPTADEAINYAVGENLAKFGRFDIDQLASIRRDIPQEYGLDGRHYSKYGPMQPILSMPLHWLAQRLPWAGNVHTVLLFNVLVTALTVVILFLTVLELGYSQRLAISLTAIFGLATPAWVYAKHYFSEPLTALCLLGGVYLAILARRRGSSTAALVAGIFGGMALATKMINGLFLLPIVIFLLWPNPGERRLRWGLIAAYVAPIALTALALGYYNWWRFGDMWQTGYDPAERFSTPLWEGLAGLLLSSGKSIFLYAPVSILAIALARVFLKQHRREGLLLVALIAAQLIVYAGWWSWWGGWSWGPRFLIPTMPFLALLLTTGLPVAWSSGLAARGAIVIVSGLSLGAQVLGITVDHTIYLASLLQEGPRPDEMTLWDLSRSPILNQFRFLRPEYLDFPWARAAGNLPKDLGTLAWLLSGLAFLTVLLALSLFGRPSRVKNYALPILSALAFAILLSYGLAKYYNADSSPVKDAIQYMAQNKDGPGAIIFAAPSHTSAFFNYNKLDLPVEGLGEEQPLRPQTLTRLAGMRRDTAELWLVTEFGPGDRGNGVEGWLSLNTFRAYESWYGPIRLARFLIGPRDTTQQQLRANFGGLLELASYELSTLPYKPGDYIYLTLYWRGLRPVGSRYKVFIHLVGPDGKIWGQRDAEPVGNFRPTDGWAVSETITDRYAVPVAPSAPRGRYSLLFGLYSAADGQRLPVLDQTGQPADDKIILADITVAGG